MWKLQRENIDVKILKSAIEETAKKRNSTKNINEYVARIQAIKEDKSMLKQWDVYKSKFYYVSEIEFIDACNVVKEILDEVFEKVN